MTGYTTGKYYVSGRRERFWNVSLWLYLSFTLMTVIASCSVYSWFTPLLEQKTLLVVQEGDHLQAWMLITVFVVLLNTLIYVRQRGIQVKHQLLDTHQKIVGRLMRLKHLYAALSRVNEAMMRITDRKELLNEICRIAVEHGQFKLAWVGIIDTESQTLDVVAASGDALSYLDGIHVSVDDAQSETVGLASMAIRENQACISNDISHDPRMLPWRDKAVQYGLHAAAACPLELEGQVVGALVLYAEEVDFFDLAMKRLLADFSIDISLALHLFARKDRRFQSEKKLHESEGKFRTLVDNLPQMIFVTDVNSVYIACNSLYAKSIGMASAHLVGKSVYDVYPAALAKKYLTYDQAILADGRAQSFEERRMLNGHEAIIHVAKAVFKDEQGRVLGVLGVLTDITGQKKYEEMRGEMEHDGRLNLAKEMASGLAHELSQPLAAVSNYLVTCQRRMADSGEWDREKLRRAVELALNQSERANGIISHIKGLVKNQGHEHDWLNINQLVEGTLVFLEDELRRYDVEVKLTLAPLPPVMACKVEIVQVLLNLYKNAIEAMRLSAERVLTVATEMASSSDVEVRLSDTGCGIAPERMDAVFNPFYTSKSDGLGLGLAICRSFIDNHGGRICVESGLQSGVVFSFTLPLQGRSAR
jgi:PAS domain S-box-containing protein